MLDYAALYEFVRKEKYSEQLQSLPKVFLSEISDFFKISKKGILEVGDSFSEDVLRLKKQFENSVSLFKELVRIRKKKILNLVFIASETGIMKKDFETMLSFEQELFDNLVVSVERAQTQLQQSISGNTAESVSKEHQMVIIKQALSEFVDMSGKLVGPFDKGMLVNLDSDVAGILVSEGKASLIDAE